MTNKTIHDLKNQLFAIKSIYEKNTSEAYDEINKICKKIDSNKVVVISSNDAVNSLVNSKVNIAKDKGINVEIESFISDINNINLVDFRMIIGNLFDNAIEACDKVLDDKKIYLELKSMNQYISITMKNSTINENVIIGITSKKDLKKHGFGLSNINEVIKDYNGNMRYEIVDNYFTINIILEKGN